MYWVAVASREHVKRGVARGFHFAEAASLFL